MFKILPLVPLEQYKIVLGLFPHLISQPRVIFGRIVGSALIRSKVCIMASTLWIPYCSRTAPHFRSWTWATQWDYWHLTQVCKWRHTHEHTARTLSAGGWWWTENKAPMMISPGICVRTRLSLFWATTPTPFIRPSKLGSVPSNTLTTNSFTDIPSHFPIAVLVLTPPAILSSAQCVVFCMAVVVPVRVRFLKRNMGRLRKKYFTDNLLSLDESISVWALKSLN